MELRVDVLRGTGLVWSSGWMCSVGLGWYGAEGRCVQEDGAGMELRVDVFRRTGLVWS